MHTPIPIRIVIADDHEVFRDGLRLMLSKESQFLVVGEAANGEELVAIVKSGNVDIVLTDIKMPRLDGIEATKQIRAYNNSTGIIALSMFNDESQVVEMLEAGAGGYLLKSADKKEMLEAIDAVYHHRPYYCQSTTARLAFSIAESRHNPYKEEDSQELFSPKEIQIIKMICKEYSAKQIGDKIYQSPRTIEGYRRIIMKKLHVKSSIGIVIYAIKKGIYKS